MLRLYLHFGEYVFPARLFRHGVAMPRRATFPKGEGFFQFYR